MYLNEVSKLKEKSEIPEDTSYQIERKKKDLENYKIKNRVKCKYQREHVRLHPLVKLTSRLAT